VEIISDTLEKRDSPTLAGFWNVRSTGSFRTNWSQCQDRRRIEDCRLQGTSIQTKCGIEGCGQREWEVRQTVKAPSILSALVHMRQ
jgi:hypothetical protein